MQERKTALPPSVANASLEELQKLFVDSLKKLKARDKRIAELTAAGEKTAAELVALQGRAQDAKSSSGAPDTKAALESQLQVSQDCACSKRFAAEGPQVRIGLSLLQGKTLFRLPAQEISVYGQTLKN